MGIKLSLCTIPVTLSLGAIIATRRIASYLAISYSVTEVSATFSTNPLSDQIPTHCKSVVVTSVESTSSQEVELKPPLVRLFLYLQPIWACYMTHCNFRRARMREED